MFQKCLLTCFKIIFRLSAIHIFEWFPPFKELWNIHISGIFKMCYCFKHYILTWFLNNSLGNFLFILSFFSPFQNVTSFWALYIFFTSFCSTFFFYHILSIFKYALLPFGVNNFHKGSFSFIIFPGQPFSNFYLFVFKV